VSRLGFARALLDPVGKRNDAAYTRASSVIGFPGVQLRRPASSDLPNSTRLWLFSITTQR
jgi:hypothetical protein